MPKVSVMIPSYNHEKYVGEAIESVLGQTFQDFELIISDDCSPDDSAKVISQYTDSRIRLHVFKKNVGATRNHEYCWSQCTGEYIALLNSDDVWEAEHLKESVAYLDGHPACGAVFSWASYMDENGEGDQHSAVVFKQPNRSRAQWLLQFYQQGNCLCHPSMVIRRVVYDHIGYYSRSLRQLPDYDEWIRLVKKYDIHVIPKVTVRFRRTMRTMQNTSAPTKDNVVRDVAESSYVLSHFFDDLDDELFAEAFRPLFRNPLACTHEEYICERFFILLDNHYYIDNLSIPHAFFYFNNVYSQPGIAQVFEEKYQYTVSDFHELGAKMDFLGLRTGDEASFLMADQNSAKHRLKALAWAVFGKDTPIYDRLTRIFKGKL